MIDVNPQQVLGDAQGVHFDSLSAETIWAADEYRLVRLQGKTKDNDVFILIIERLHGYDALGQERWIALTQMDSQQLQTFLGYLRDVLLPTAIPAASAPLLQRHGV